MRRARVEIRKQHHSGNMRRDKTIPHHIPSELKPTLLFVDHLIEFLKKSRVMVLKNL